MTAGTAADAVLFFIPDLGGFTKFIAETEVQHSQHIIQNLLELLVDANSLGLNVAEFEGDAVLFYRDGVPPSLAQLVEQARRMYLAFHTRLRLFESRRTCDCGACAGAIHMTLKMVAHFGSARTMKVKDHVKFIGRDIIIAHRLLKNSVDVREYLLVTQPSLGEIADAEGQLMSFAEGEDAYEDLGTIAYRFRPLHDYRAEVEAAAPAPADGRSPAEQAR